MKHSFFALLLLLSIASCMPGTKTDTPGSPDGKQGTSEAIPASDATTQDTSSGVVQQKTPYKTKDVEGIENQIDTSNYDPHAVPTKKYESPKVNPNITAHECNPNFHVLSKNQRQHHFYYVTDFNPQEFKCWAELEKHGTAICNEQPCIIYYLDSPGIKVSTASSNQIDATTLLKHGIGKYEHSGKFWEVRGASIWKRKEKGFGYYNSNNHLGG